MCCCVYIYVCVLAAWGAVIRVDCRAGGEGARAAEDVPSEVGPARAPLDAACES